RPADAAALLAAPLTLDGDGFYSALGEAGVDARPYARAVTGVTEAGGRRLLVRVAEPAMCQDPHKQHVSIPAWVLAGLAQGVQHATGRPRTTALRAAALYGADLTDTRALLLEPVAEATFRITFLDGDGRALGAVEDAEFTDGTLPPSLEGGAVPVRAELPGAARPLAAASVPATALPAPHSEPPAAPAAEADADAGDALVAVLRETVADLLKFELDEIDLDTHFHAYGFESIALARLASELNGLLGTDLSPVVFFECPDIRSLAAHLRERYDAETAARAVRGTGDGTGTDAARAPTPAPAPAVGAASAATAPAPLSSAEPVSYHEADYPGAVAVVGVAGRAASPAPLTWTPSGSGCARGTT
ncbi:acyl carrier protein, partial [Streptomyces nanshensis]